MEISTDTRRNQLEIYLEILDFTELPRRPTHIMHKTNQSYSQLKKHLSWLLEKGLLEEVVKPFHAFHTTKKGKDFIEMLNAGNSKNKEFFPGKFVREEERLA